MTPRKRRSSEPRHLSRMQKTCPRTDCPNPTRGMEWRGSPKQHQYHCFGCWRKFNYGGILRSWATQVTPSATWLRSLPAHERKKPDLPEPPRRRRGRRSVSPEPEPPRRSVSPEPEPPRRSVSPMPEPPRRSVSPMPEPPRRSVSPMPEPPRRSVPAAQQVHELARGQAERSVASSSQMTGSARGLHVAVDSYLAWGSVELVDLERNLRADNNVQRKEPGACATQGQDRDAGETASTEIDLVENGAGEDACHGMGTPFTSPTWHDLTDMTPFETFDEFGVGGGPTDLLPEPFGDFGASGGFIPEPLGEFGVGGSALPTWSFDSTDPENSFWEDEASTFGIEFPAVPEPPGTKIIIPSSDDSNDVQSSDYSITASSASPITEDLVLPQGKTMKISFVRYAVPTVTCLYEMNC